MGPALFRREAVERQGERLWGELVLGRPPALLMFSLLLLGITAAALAFLALGDYSRRQQVRGYLVPDRGLVEIAPPREGQLVSLAVRQGERVEKGQLLFEVQVDRRVGGEVPLSEAQLEQLKAQEAALAQRLALEEESLSLLRESREARRRRQQEELAGLARVLALESELAALRRREHERAAQLRATGMLAQSGLEAVRAARLAQDRAVENLRLQRLRLESALEEGRLEQHRAELAARQHLLDLGAQLAELRKQGLGLEAQRRNRVFAPVAGRVAGLGASPGQLVGPGRALLSLVPEDSRLEAELLVPSRAVAFLAPGQAVNLRYDAFPYQKFGVHRAVLREVDGSAGGGEGVYRARAALESQSVAAYGEAVALRPGMLLSADIVVEKRSLLHWLLDPLLSLRGRL